MKIKSDLGCEFENEPFEKLCETHRILHDFSSSRTPQYNGVVQRKNRSLEEMPHTMISESKIAKRVGAEA